MKNKTIKIQVWTYQDQVERILKDHYNALALVNNKVWFNPKTKKKRKPDTKTIANWKRACARINKKYANEIKKAVQCQDLATSPISINTISYKWDGNNITKLDPKTPVTPTKDNKKP